MQESVLDAKPDRVRNRTNAAPKSDAECIIELIEPRPL